MGDENNPEAVAFCELCIRAMRQNIGAGLLWFLSIAILVVLFNTVDFFRPPGETAGSWLERSGALIGVAGILIEFRTKRMNNVLSNSSMKLAPTLFRRISFYSKHMSVLHVLGLFCACFGALIWSYGEPIFNALDMLGTSTH